MSRARDFFDSNAGKVTAMAVGVIGLVILIMVIKSAFGESEGAAESRGRVFVDSQTGKSFKHSLVEGETYPIKAPSGEKTGYPAEMCYWTKDGKVKEYPTPVLLNEYVGKHEPTFCPDCGRLVVGHNPPAAPGKTPPPTKEEYMRHGSAGASGAAPR